MSTKKKSVSSSSPKSVLDKIIYAIRNQPPSAAGVSRVAITKYLKNQLDFDNPSALKAAFKKGLSSGKIQQNGQSFLVCGDPVSAVTLSNNETVRINEVKEGLGPVALKGHTVVVSYDGRLASDGTLFDSAKSFEFILGAGEVIKGWDQGISGMKVGGQRELFVPSKLGYGKRGSSPDIPKDADLSFIVTLKKIK